MRANGFKKGDIIRVKATGEIRVIDMVNESFCPPIFVGDDLYMPREIEAVSDVATTIARRFCSILRNKIGESNLRLVVERNKEEEDRGVCHSHDFCDANVAMQDATGAPEDDVLNNDAWVEIWNEAWEIAKAAGFDASRIEEKP